MGVVDHGSAVDEAVDQSEAQQVRFGAGEDAAHDAGVGLGERVLMSLAMAFRTLANSASTTSRRGSLVPGSAPEGSRSAQMSPSPLESPLEVRVGKLGSALVMSAATWSQEEPLRALADSPT